MGNACGGFFGIRATHTKSHLARSAYEGFALSMYDCYKNLPVAEEKLYIAGGASASNFICQLVCDCIGSKTYRFSGKELGIMGVYNIICNSLQINCANNFNLEDEFIPNEENHEKYNQLYASFVIYRNCMMGIWKQNI
ncbi:hypothetical protein SDC9_185538 [bioreactor metagenome]|uniref:Carbohydrate kinase FGGY C-terminal domain-containing protein n=1 Tax=bioreactor metagenome TaxID=1076179 RepID=A0A645HHG0_9ZZZZ